MKAERDLTQLTSKGPALAAPALQRAAVNEPAVTDVPLIVGEVLRAPGQPLSAETRAFFEPRFGQDFSGVRVHTDEKAAESAEGINASAYAVGQHIVFGEGQYSVDTSKGRALLVHELTHTSQQRKETGIKPPLTMERSDSSAESEAAKNEVRVGTENRIGTRIASGVKIAREEIKHSGKKYWFNVKVPEEVKKDWMESTTVEGYQVESLGREWVFTKDNKLKIRVQYFCMPYDFKSDETGLKATEEITRAKASVGATLASMLKTLANPLPTENVEERNVRLQLVTALRQFKDDGNPLMIFLSSKTSSQELEEGQPMPRVPQTGRVYINAEDVGHPEKLKAAIWLPGEKLEKPKAIQERGEGAGEEGAKAKYSRDAGALLHELMHVTLINREASAGQIWNRIESGLVKVPVDAKFDAKSKCEVILQHYLNAQEELFVYEAIRKIEGVTYETPSKYEAFLVNVDLFLDSGHAVGTTQEKRLSIDGGVGPGAGDKGNEKKKETMSITYHYPASVKVSDSDLQAMDKLLDEWHQMYGGK